MVRLGPRVQNPPSAAVEQEFGDVTPKCLGIAHRAGSLGAYDAAVDRVTATVLDDRCVIRAFPRVEGSDVSLEVWGASRKSDVLEKALGVEVVLAAGL